MALKHISGWVEVTEPNVSGPIDPGWGVRPPVDPGYGRPGWSPADPGYGRPDWAPGHIGGGPIVPGHPGNKPPGAPVLPPSADNGLPPNGGQPPHPWLPGHWRPVDPGFGGPPLWGFVPADPGFGIPETPPPAVGGGPVKPPGGGQWVPTDPGFGQPIRPCPPVTGKPHPPIWAWIPDKPAFPDNPKPPDFGGKPPVAQPK